LEQNKVSLMRRSPAPLHNNRVGKSPKMPSTTHKLLMPISLVALVAPDRTAWYLPSDKPDYRSPSTSDLQSSLTFVIGTTANPRLAATAATATIRVHNPMYPNSMQLPYKLFISQVNCYNSRNTDTRCPFSHRHTAFRS
jgi:hypothetical protein